MRIETEIAPLREAPLYAAPGPLWPLLGFWLAQWFIPFHLLQSVQLRIGGISFPFYYPLLSFWVTGALVLWFFRGPACKGRPAFAWALPLLCLLGVFFGASFTWSARSFVSFALRGFVPGLLFYFACRNWRDAASIAWNMCLAAVGLALIALWEIGTGNGFMEKALCLPIFNAVPKNVVSDPQNFLYQAHRVYSDPVNVFSLSALPQVTIGNRIPFASCLTAFAAVALFYSEISKRKKLSYSCFVLLLIVIVFSLVRSAWMGTAFSLFLYLRLRRKKPGGRPRVWLFLCVGVVFIAAATGRAIKIKDRFIVDGAVLHRLASYGTAFRVWKTKPVAGVGMGNFPRVYRPYHYLDGTKYYATPDNQYMRWLSETGLAGLAGLFLFLGISIRIAWNRIHQMEDLIQSNFILALLCGFIGIAITFAFFDGFGWGAAQITFWAFLGLIWACVFPAKQEGVS